MAIRAVTFDVYSALFDTLTGLAAALAQLLRERGAAGDAQALARSWRAKHMEYLLLATALDPDAPGRPRMATNRRAIERSAAYALRGVVEPPLTADERTRLIAAWEHLPPWPEAGDVLWAVRVWPEAGGPLSAQARPLILGALSNGDAGMLDALLARLPVGFDHVISTEGGPFKPHRAVYERALRALGVPRDGVLHVAGSPTDAMGATAAGIRTLWVNRTGDAVVEPTLSPAHEGRDLRSVLDVLTQLE